MDFAAWAVWADSESETGRFQAVGRRGLAISQMIRRDPDGRNAPDQELRRGLEGRRSSLDRWIAGRRPAGKRKVPWTCGHARHA